MQTTCILNYSLLYVYSCIDFQKNTILKNKQIKKKFWKKKMLRKKWKYKKEDKENKIEKNEFNFPWKR